MNHQIINARKKQLGITNVQLAEMTGITLSTLEKITSGRNKNPTLDTLQAIADAIGCEIDDFRDTPRPKISPSAMRIATLYDATNSQGRELFDSIATFVENNF